MDNATSVVPTQVRGEELGRHHIPPDNVSCLHRTPTLGTHSDRSGLIPSCLRYLYEDNLFIGIQRVKLRPGNNYKPTGHLTHRSKPY